MPFSHLTLTVSHLPTSTSFFLSCLQPLGYQFIGRSDDYIGFGQKPGEPADFWITEQKPGTPPGAAHIAFPASSKDAVGSFFVRALKAGAKFHGEPKTRDSDSGYYSAAVLDFDGNSIEAVYRPSSSSAKSEVSVSPRGLLMEGSGSVVSKSSSKVSAAKPESYVAPKSIARAPESHVSKTSTAVDRAAPSVTSHQQTQRSSGPTYIVQNQKSDDGNAAKTIVGSLIGAAAGAAIAYAFTKADSSSDSFSLQEAPREYAQLPAPSQAASQAPRQAGSSAGYKFIEAPPARSTYSQNDASRPMLTRSVTSKNPRASTIYEGTEFHPQQGPPESVYLDDQGRRASEGSVYTTRDLPLRAIEYQPDAYPCNPSTLISSFHEKPRQMSTGSIYSSSTIRPPKSSTSNHNQDSQSAYYSIAKSQSPSTASSTRTARKVPLPQGSTPSLSSYRSSSKSAVSARNIPLPESANGSSVIPEEHVAPEDSASQLGGRSTHSHRSKTGSRASSKRSSKFDEPVRPSDSVSQVSSHVSQRTIKADEGGDWAGGSKAGSKAGSQAGSKVSSRRGSQAW